MVVEEDSIVLVLEVSLLEAARIAYLIICLVLGLKMIACPNSYHSARSCLVELYMMSIMPYATLPACNVRG